MVAGVLIFIFLQTLGDLYLPTLMGDIVNDGVMQGDTSKIMHIGGLMLLVTAGGVICAVVASFLSARIAVGLGTILRSKIFRRVESFSLHEFDKIGTATLITRTTNDINQIQMVTVMIMSVTQLSILWFGGLRIAHGDLDLGKLSSFTQYAMQIMFSMIMLAVMFIMVPRAQAAAARINEVLETEPEILDPKETKELSSARGYIEFKDVSFSYHGAEEQALRNISFAARPGEFTAIIGSTGSGKSTLINLIPRFYDVGSGSILIDGTDVRELTQESLRSRIGFVPQKAVLFSGTIADNIKVGKEDATDEEIRHAAEVAQASEFIAGMDGGFEHEIAQGGTNVSGGQKQRLSIARALIRKPEIYIFDDSFSALDFKTDAKLRAALKREIAESTVIIVTQRVGTVMDADRIIVLDDGQVAGMGTHKELLANCKVYREIVESQLSEEEIA
jgi:ATP-binding cassette subfamily B protein